MADDTTRTGDVEVTTDHGTIREWIERHDATVARLAEPAADEAGLAVVSEGRTDGARELSWEEFFELFEAEGLAFVYRTAANAGERPDCEFADRGTVGAGTGRSEATRSEDEATGRDALAELEGRATGTGSSADGKSLESDEVDGSEIVAGETTRRGETDEGGIDEPADGARTDATGEPETSHDGEPGAPGESAEPEPAEPLGSEVETTDTIEREPLGSETEGGRPEPMETAADEEGVEPAEPGAPAPDETIPSDREPPASEPAEPAEGEIGGEPIGSGSMTGEGADLDDDPDQADVIRQEPGSGETNDGSAGSGAETGSETRTGGSEPTAEDEGKDVVDETGDRIGVVADVEEGAIRVDPDPELSDERRDALGWGEHGNETYRLEHDRIRDTTATEVVIRR